MVCKMEAQSEYVHIAYTCTFGTNLYAQSVLIKISASELSREFIKGARCWLGRFTSMVCLHGKLYAYSAVHQLTRETSG